MIHMRVPEGTQAEDLKAIVACLKGQKGITLDLSDTQIKMIPEKAFKECSALKSVILPEGLVSIWKGAFAGCNSLTSVVIPASVTSIGVWAFYWCTRLVSVTFGDTGGWYADKKLTESVEAGDLASHVKRGGRLYKKTK